jgi:hypothetical protein
MPMTNVFPEPSRQNPPGLKEGNDEEMPIDGPTGIHEEPSHLRTSTRLLFWILENTATTVPSAFMHMPPAVPERVMSDPIWYLGLAAINILLDENMIESPLYFFVSTASRAKSIHRNPGYGTKPYWNPPRIP